ncbi:MAG: FtsH protease activity modulator HflK [Victivallaceae bacterium]|nr:FtsH protease activity modulator HflK [Victivallaceae bacterium]
MNRKEQTLIVSIGANCVLIALRFLLAFISGSLALKANAWHSMADMIVLGIVLTGLIIASQTNNRFRGIMARAEHIVAMIVAVFILYMGIDLFFESLSGEMIELRYLTWAALGAFFGVCITYFMGRYMLYVGQKENSPSLIAAGYHARMDMLCSSAVLIGLLGSIFGMSGLDKIAASIVVIFIFIAAIEIFTVNLKALRSGKISVTEHNHQHGIGKPGWTVVAALSAICLAGYFASGIYFVQPDEQAIVRRLGKISDKLMEPGIHYRWPYPVESVDKVSTSTIRQVVTPRRLILTGDETLTAASIAVHFRVKDAKRYLLSSSAPDRIVKNAAESGLRAVIGRNVIDILLTTGREMVANETREALQQELDRNGIGVEVIGVLIRDLAPPNEVKSAFQDVASAREDRITYINEAYSFFNALVPDARAKAAARLLSAEAYRDAKIDRTKGESARFLKKVEAYSKGRDITRVRLYIEAMEKILPNVRKFLVGSNVETTGTDLWFINSKTKTPFNFNQQR